MGKNVNGLPVTLAVPNEPRFASVPPARVVPVLAAEGVCLGSLDSNLCCMATTVLL
jgi:hypothetical protein